MAVLSLHNNVIEEFKKEGKLNLSENGGILFWLNAKQKQIVYDYEKKSGNLVYHVISSFTEDGEVYALLYVSTYPGQWDLDLNDLKEGICRAYVKNVNMDWCSEDGYIGFNKCIGGLVRVA